MTREEQLSFLNREIERLSGVEEDLKTATTQYQKKCLQACVDVLNKYRLLRNEMMQH